MNRIILSGRLCADPEVRVTSSGVSVTSFRLAVKRPGSSGTTDFFSVTAWRQTADFLCRYGHRGDVVILDGILTVRSFTDKDGKDRTSWEIVADRVELPGNRREESGDLAQGLPETGGNVSDGKTVTGNVKDGHTATSRFVDDPDAGLPF